jgi:hypothetical protein
MSHVFFSKDVMDAPACAAVEITFRPLPAYRKVDDMAMEALSCGQKYSTTTKQT